MRSISSPGYFGSVVGGPVQHRFFEWRDGDPRINGPFKSLEDFRLGIALHSQKQEELNDRHLWNSECMHDTFRKH